MVALKKNLNRLNEYYAGDPLVDPEDQVLFQKINNKIRNNFNMQNWNNKKYIYYLGNLEVEFKMGDIIIMKKNDLKYSGAGYDTIYNQDDYEYKQKLFVDNTDVKSLLDFILHEYKVSGRKSLQSQFD